MLLKIPVLYVFFISLKRCLSCSLPQIDRLYDWKRSSDTDVVATLKKQKKNTKDEFDERAKAVMLEFAQQVCEHSTSIRSWNLPFLYQPAVGRANGVNHVSFIL